MVGEPSDLAQIERVIVRYALLLDSGNQDILLGNVFTDDAVLHYDVDDIVGANAIRSFYSNRPSAVVGMMHFVSNFSIDVDGDEATSLSYYQAWHWFSQSDVTDPLAPVTFASVGCFDDELVRTSDGWRIRRRTIRPITPGAIGIGEPPSGVREMFVRRASQPNLRSPGSPPRAALPR